MVTTPRPTPLIERSGQRTRLFVAGGLFVGGAGLLLLIQSGVFGDVSLVPLMALGFVLAVAGAALATRGVRCPICGLFWVQWAMGHESASQWVSWLLNFDECPGCSCNKGSEAQRDAI
jgi:hypothetical protein